MSAGIVVVGAGQAACQLIASLRQLGHAEPLTLVGAEPYLPYQRPPLSKDCLRRGATLADLLLRPTSFYDSQRCRQILGRRAIELDRAARVLRLDDGQAIEYEHLVLATGARARRWPGLADVSPHVFTLRSWDDAQALGERLTNVRRLAVLGAGYVGLEVAASAAQRGIEVAVFEAAPRVLQRSVGTAMSVAVQRLHAQHGVRLCLGATVRAVEVSAATNARNPVRLTTTDESFTADALVVGIGAAPRIELAQQAGIACGQGIRIDAACRTSDPHVWAIGDCTEQVLGDGEPPIRLESVQNATDQAKCAAAVLAGKPIPPAPVPWFWSDQFGCRIQVAGRSAAGDEIIFRSVAEKRLAFAAWHLRDGRVTAVETLDAPEDFMAARQLIRSGRFIERATLCDDRVSLRELVTQT